MGRQQPPRELEYQVAGPSDEAEQPASAFRVQRLLGFLLAYWWIPATTLVIGSLAVGAFIFWKPPTYVSHARMVETLKLRLPEGNLFSEDAQTSLGTQTELLQSSRLRDETLRRLQAGSNNISIPRGKDGEVLPVTIRVNQSSRSSVFTLEASGTKPGYVVAYLNALMDVYLEYKKTVRAQVSGYTLASISEQVQIAERDLKDEQNVLLDFERTNGFAMLQEVGTVNGGYLARLKTQLSDLQLEDRLLKASAADQLRVTSLNKKVAEYKRLSDLTETLSKKRLELLTRFAPQNSWVVEVDGQIAANEKLKAQLLADNPDLASMQTPGDDGLHIMQLASTDSSTSAAESTQRMASNRELQELKIQRERLSKYLKPQHPKIVKLDTDIDRARKLVAFFRQQGQEQLTASRNQLQLKIENIQNSIKEWEGRVVEANARIAQADRLKVNVQQKQQIVDRLNLLLQNVGLSRNIDQEPLQILEYASSATRTYTQEIGLGAAGSFGGLIVGVGIILLIALRDDRFTSALEVIEKFGDSVVAQVPEIRTNGSASNLLVDHGEDQHMYAESYRNLRSALRFLAFDGERPKVVLITSALPNEGKSTVAANLARTLALGGSKVLLVDADLRRGVLHKVLGFQATPGLSELLRQPGGLPQAMQTNSLPNLEFISAGARLRNPGDQFLGQSFDHLLEQWRQEFDYVVLDCTPVFAADDATTLAPKADGTLFVVRNRYSGAQQVREALELLYQRQARVLGLVFNCADASLRSYHYYKYGEYYATKSADAG